MEMKEPNEKECLVHSRDNRGRKVSPVCSSGGDESGTSKFREFPRNCVGAEEEREDTVIFALARVFVIFATVKRSV